jgi:hypothetical protein
MDTELIQKIERLMYGRNFEVHIGTDLFEGNSEEDFFLSVKRTYPEIKTEYMLPLVETNAEAMLIDIRDKFSYRGDEHAGLRLSEEKQAELQRLQSAYIDFLKQQLNSNSKCFKCCYEEFGLPGDPVFWEYCYVLFSGNTITFTHGCASD